MTPQGLCVLADSVSVRCNASVIAPRFNTPVSQSRAATSSSRSLSSINWRLWLTISWQMRLILNDDRNLIRDLAKGGLVNLTVYILCRLVKNRKPIGRWATISGQVRLERPPSCTIRRVRVGLGFLF